MNKKHLDLLQYLYNETSLYSFVKLYSLEIEFGMSGQQLRSLLEDLKEEGLVVEAEEGFGISRVGINFGKSKWV